MNCASCNGETEKRFVTHTEDLGKCVVVIRNVPAMVCNHCSNVRFTGTVVGQIEIIVDLIAKTAITEVAIVNYTEQAA